MNPKLEILQPHKQQQQQHLKKEKENTYQC